MKTHPNVVLALLASWALAAVLGAAWERHRLTRWTLQPAGESVYRMDRETGRVRVIHPNGRWIDQDAAPMVRRSSPY